MTLGGVVREAVLHDGVVRGWRGARRLEASSSFTTSALWSADVSTVMSARDDGDGDGGASMANGSHAMDESLSAHRALVLQRLQHTRPAKAGV